jgi:hypothetical protein
VKVTSTGPPGFDSLRATYRSHWDAYQVIADGNLRRIQDGDNPTKEDLKSERRAALAVERARDALLAAISRLGQEKSSTAGL